MTDHAKRTPRPAATVHASPADRTPAAPRGAAAGTAYRITVGGVVDHDRSSWFDGMSIAHDASGNTTLAGSVRDQAELHGLIAKVRDMGLTLLTVEPRSADPTVDLDDDARRTRSQTGPRGRSPAPSVLASMVAGAVVAIGLLLASGGQASEPSITGSVLIALAISWGLAVPLSMRFSDQPQPWMVWPGAALGLSGAGLVLLQPGPEVMDLMSWVWPPAVTILALWMFGQARAHLRGRGRWLVVPAIGVLFLLGIGGGLATVGEAVSASEPAPSGRMIDVGGRRLYIECTGVGAPVVVLQSGLGESSSYWSRIAPAVASSTAVCRYDRAGRGLSDDAPMQQDGVALAADLHTLLERAGIAGPYLLVGHSAGGPYVRIFAHRYPGEVAGMVLLDAQPADAFEALPDYPMTYRGLRMAAALLPSLARVGLLGPVLGFPADQSTAAAARSARDELAALPVALWQARMLTSLGDRPLVVVTAENGQQAGWAAAQDAMAALSTNSVHVRVDSATHSSLITGDGAPASAQAILDVVSTVRAGIADR